MRTLIINRISPIPSLLTVFRETTHEVDNSLYIFSITLVAAIGGLLFGYDTAVISGAEKSLKVYFI